MWKIIKEIKKGDYLYALVPNHPNATKNGYVLYHRVVMENKIGRLLKRNELVHHKDENKHNNNVENLKLMTSEDHGRLHNKTGRTFVELTCPECEIVFSRERKNTHLVKKGKLGVTCCSPSCRGKYSRKIQLQARVA